MESRHSPPKAATVVRIHSGAPLSAGLLANRKELSGVKNWFKTAMERFGGAEEDAETLYQRYLDMSRQMEIKDVVRKIFWRFPIQSIDLSVVSEKNGEFFLQIQVTVLFPAADPRSYDAYRRQWLRQLLIRLSLDTEKKIEQKYHMNSSVKFAEIEQPPLSFRWPIPAVDKREKPYVNVEQEPGQQKPHYHPRETAIQKKLRKNREREEDEKAQEWLQEHHLGSSISQAKKSIKSLVLRQLGMPTIKSVDVEMKRRESWDDFGFGLDISIMEEMEKEGSLWTTQEEHENKWEPIRRNLKRLIKNRYGVVPWLRVRGKEIERVGGGMRFRPFVINRYIPDNFV
jgi:hypothetical protein